MSIPDPQAAVLARLEWFSCHNISPTPREFRGLVSALRDALAQQEQGWQEKLDRARETIEGQITHIEWGNVENRRVEVEKARLRQALHRHGGHLMGCAFTRKSTMACSCGLAAALASQTPESRWTAEEIAEVKKRASERMRGFGLNPQDHCGHEYGPFDQCVFCGKPKSASQTPETP